MFQLLTLLSALPLPVSALVPCLHPSSHSADWAPRLGCPGWVCLPWVLTLCPVPVSSLPLIIFIINHFTQSAKDQAQRWLLNSYSPSHQKLKTNKENLRLDRLFSKDHHPFLQRTWGWFPAQTWWLTIIFNCSFSWSYPPSDLCRHWACMGYACIHTCIHTYKHTYMYACIHACMQIHLK